MQFLPIKVTHKKKNKTKKHKIQRKRKHSKKMLKHYLKNYRTATRLPDKKKKKKLPHICKLANGNTFARQQIVLCVLAFFFKHLVNVCKKKSNIN